MVLYLLALLSIAATTLFVHLGNDGGAVWYLLAVPFGLMSAVLTAMCSAAFLSADNSSAAVRGSILCVVAGFFTALFVVWGHRDSWAYYLLAAPCGLLAVFAAVFGYLETFPPDPQKVQRQMAEEDARYQAEMRDRGWVICRGCNELAPPPGDGRTCHGCGGPLTGGEYKCVCGTCYAAHLASN